MLSSSIEHGLKTLDFFVVQLEVLLMSCIIASSSLFRDFVVQLEVLSMSCITASSSLFRVQDMD